VGASKDVVGKGMVVFEFLHFLSVVVISFKGSQMTWWFKVFFFHGENQQPSG